MAVGLGGDFKVYEEQFYGGMFEEINQMVDKFNAASNGALALVQRSHRGDFEHESFMKDLGSTLVQHRDTEDVSGVASAAMTQEEEIRPKIARRIGPVENTLDSWRKIGKTPEEQSFVLGQQIGPHVFRDYVNTLLGGLVAAIPQVKVDSGGAANDFVNNVSDEAGGGTPLNITPTNMVDTLALMGDKAQSVVAWVMHSTSQFALMKQHIADKIFEVAGVTIITGTAASLNRPIIVTDSPDLLADDVGVGVRDQAKILALVANAGTIIESETQELVSKVITGLENLTFRIQGEHSFDVGIKGMKWDLTALRNPTDATLKTSANWLQAADFGKNGPGAMLIVDRTVAAS